MANTNWELGESSFGQAITGFPDLTGFKNLLGLSFYKN